jgi:hypothetical protein
MNRTEFIKSLLSATLLIYKAMIKKIPIHEFMRQYDNFYYYEALDGHEADETKKIILDEFKIVIQLNEKVQTQVIDQLYLKETNKDMFMKVGRIGEPEAIKRITAIGKEFNIEHVIKKLNDLLRQ